MELTKNQQQILDLVKEMNAVELNGLVKALEEEFGLEIPDEDVEKIVTVKDVVEYISENI